MSDLISRQAAIDAILHNQEFYLNNFGNDRIVNGYTIAIIDNDAQIIAQLPSAQPERKSGKWLWVDGVRCSSCNYKLQTTGLPSYCPNCGADMRGGDTP